MKKCKYCGKPLPSGRWVYCSEKCRSRSNYREYREYYRKYFKKRRKKRIELIWDIFINGGAYEYDSDEQTI